MVRTNPGRSGDDAIKGLEYELALRTVQLEQALSVYADHFKDEMVPSPRGEAELCEYIAGRTDEYCIWALNLYLQVREIRNKKQEEKPMMTLHDQMFIAISKLVEYAFQEMNPESLFQNDGWEESRTKKKLEEFKVLFYEGTYQ